MAQISLLASVMNSLRKMFSCTAKNNEGEEVDGARVNVTTTNVSNYTCCASRASNRNDDDVYVKTESKVPVRDEIVDTGGALSCESLAERAIKDDESERENSNLQDPATVQVRSSQIIFLDFCFDESSEGGH